MCTTLRAQCKVSRMTADKCTSLKIHCETLDPGTVCQIKHTRLIILYIYKVKETQKYFDSMTSKILISLLVNAELLQHRFSRCQGSVPPALEAVRPFKAGFEPVLPFNYHHDYAPAWLRADYGHQQCASGNKHHFQQFHDWKPPTHTSQQN